MRPAAAGTLKRPASSSGVEHTDPQEEDGFDNMRDRVKANKFRDMYDTLPVEIQQAYAEALQLTMNAASAAVEAAGVE